MRSQKQGEVAFNKRMQCIVGKWVRIKDTHWSFLRAGISERRRKTKRKERREEKGKQQEEAKGKQQKEKGVKYSTL